MNEVDNTLLMQRIAAQLERAEDAKRRSGNGGGEPPHLEARIAKVESDIENIKVTLVDVKTDIRGLRSDITGVRDKMETDFRVTWAGIIALALGIGGLLAKAFHWFT